MELEQGRAEADSRVPEITRNTSDHVDDVGEV